MSTINIGPIKPSIIYREPDNIPIIIPNVTARTIPSVTRASVTDRGPIKSPEVTKSNKILATVARDGKKNSPVNEEMSCHKASNVKEPKTLKIMYETLKMYLHHL